jgi:hypothetical protein
MAAHAVFNFSARFLSSGPPSSQSGRKSKLLTRRAASRMPIQCVQTGESLFSHEIISVAPAIADIDVVASLPEVAPVPEATATVPAIVLVTASEVEPNDADQNAVIPFPAKVMNSGTEPENDHILRVKNAAPEIVLATEITVTVQTIANVEPVPAIPRFQMDYRSIWNRQLGRGRNCINGNQAQYPQCSEVFKRSPRSSTVGYVHRLCRPSQVTGLPCPL